MDELMIDVAAIIGVCILIGSISAIITIQRKTSLPKKFKALGTLRGMSFNDIVQVVGPPKGISHTENGSSRVWSNGYYTVTLIFDKNDICLGVDNEFVS